MNANDFMLAGVSETNGVLKSGLTCEFYLKGVISPRKCLIASQNETWLKNGILKQLMCWFNFLFVLF